MIDYALNLRRIMARSGLTLAQVVEATALSSRTVKAILNGKNRPQARTLHRLASGLGISTDELFQNAVQLVQRSFDRPTNPIVDKIMTSCPELFEGWIESDFDDLYSRFGTDSPLTANDVLTAVDRRNRERSVHQKVALLLKSDEADFLIRIVELLFQRMNPPAQRRKAGQ